MLPILSHPPDYNCPGCADLNLSNGLHVVFLILSTIRLSKTHKFLYFRKEPELPTENYLGKKTPENGHHEDYANDLKT